MAKTHRSRSVKNTKQSSLEQIWFTLLGDAVVTQLWVMASSLLGEAATNLQEALGLQDRKGIDVVLNISLLLISLVLYSPMPMRVFKGALFNPVNSIALMVAEREEAFLSACRMAAQTIGAVSGSIAAVRLIPKQYQGLCQGTIATYTTSLCLYSGYSLIIDIIAFTSLAGGLRDGYSIQAGCACEMVLSLLMNLLFLFSLDMRSKQLAFWGPLMATAVWCYVGSFITGPTLNPSVAYSWDLQYHKHSKQEHFVVFWLGPILGAALAGLLYKQLSKSPTKTSRQPGKQPVKRASNVQTLKGGKSKEPVRNTTHNKEANGSANSYSSMSGGHLVNELKGQSQAVAKLKAAVLGTDASVSSSKLRPRRVKHKMDL